MHEGLVGRSLVINTSPTLALLAAAGTLDFLSALYQRVLMPREVLDELLADELDGPSVERLIRRAGVTVEEHNTTPPELLLNSLDRGEASVIQLALSRGIPLVGIDERAGRRLARLCGLEVTGSLGILIRARKCGHVPSLRECMQNMSRAGIWLGVELKAEVLRLAGEV